MAAYLLARGGFVTRPEAEIAAHDYHSSPEARAEEDPLVPSAVREWTQQLSRRAVVRPVTVPQAFVVDLADDFPVSSRGRSWRVVPAIGRNQIRWLDPAGRMLATSSRAAGGWDDSWAETMTFSLDPSSASVAVARYV